MKIKRTITSLLTGGAAGVRPHLLFLGVLSEPSGMAHHEDGRTKEGWPEKEEEENVRIFTGIERRM